VAAISSAGPKNQKQRKEEQRKPETQTEKLDADCQRLSGQSREKTFKGQVRVTLNAVSRDHPLDR
jgi:hypothetical protein